MYTYPRKLYRGCDTQVVLKEEMEVVSMTQPYGREPSASK